MGNNLFQYTWRFICISRPQSLPIIGPQPPMYVATLGYRIFLIISHEFSRILHFRRRRLCDNSLVDELELPWTYCHIRSESGSSVIRSCCGALYAVWHRDPHPSFTIVKYNVVFDGMDTPANRDWMLPQFDKGLTHFISEYIKSQPTITLPISIVTDR